MEWLASTLKARISALGCCCKTAWFTSHGAACATSAHTADGSWLTALSLWRRLPPTSPQLQRSAAGYGRLVRAWPRMYSSTYISLPATERLTPTLEARTTVTAL